MAKRARQIDIGAQVRVVRVGPFDYHVKFIDAPRDMAEHVGYTRNESHEIGVLLHGPAANIADTLLHEVLHAVANVYGLRNHPELDTDAVEEKVVMTFTNGLLQVVRDNPDLVIALVQLVNAGRDER